MGERIRALGGRGRTADQDTPAKSKASSPARVGKKVTTPRKAGGA